MSGTLQSTDTVIPARLACLAVYSPLLGTTDETVGDQIVFHYSRRSRARRKLRRNTSSEAAAKKNDENETIRQIGLAQGMVEFARTFSSGQAVDSVETEKSRIVIHELESGWWIFVSVDLTRLPASSTATPSPDRKGDGRQPAYEYSAREVSPAALLTQQLLQAYTVFLLHHGRCLAEIYVRIGRPRFCSILDRFWTRFARSWDVLLHGNPAVEAFGGIKLAAGGELGIGVGEERWGSGEREVLEGMVYRTDGMLEMMVSRFDDAGPEEDSPAKKHKRRPRELRALGKDTGSQAPVSDPAPADGVVFSGVRALSRTSTRALALWMQSLYRYDVHAYGVLENPMSTSRRKEGHSQPMETGARSANAEGDDTATAGEESSHKKAPPGLRAQGLGDIYSPGSATEQLATPRAERRAISEHGLSSRTAGRDKHHRSSDGAETSSVDSSSSSSTFMKYVTLGYGSSWGTVSKSGEAGILSSGSSAKKAADPDSKISQAQPEPDKDQKEGPTGHFLVGLQGSLEEESGADDDANRSGTVSAQDSETEDASGRIMLRTAHVQLVDQKPSKREDHDETCSGLVDLSPEDIRPRETHQTVRVVVYKHPPFIYTLLFELRTPSLAIPAFYHSLHHLLGPLQRSLLASTASERAIERLQASGFPYSGLNVKSPSSRPLYDLIYDPEKFSIISSIPNIPDPPPSLTGVDAAYGYSPAVAHGQKSGSCREPWTRIEALNVHTQILNIFGSTRPSTGPTSTDMEQSCKTSRGWWVVWKRLPSSDAASDTPGAGAGTGTASPSSRTRCSESSSQDEPRQSSEQSSSLQHASPLREAILIRKAAFLGSGALPSSSSGAGGSGVGGSLRSVSNSFAATLLKGSGFGSGGRSVSASASASASATAAPSPSVATGKETGNSKATGGTSPSPSLRGTLPVSGSLSLGRDGGDSSAEAKGISTAVEGLSGGIDVDAEDYIRELFKVYQ